MPDRNGYNELFRAAVIASAVFLLAVAGWWVYRWMFPPVSYYLVPYP